MNPLILFISDDAVFLARAAEAASLAEIMPVTAPTPAAALPLIAAHHPAVVFLDRAGAAGAGDAEDAEGAKVAKVAADWITQLPAGVGARLIHPALRAMASGPGADAPFAALLRQAVLTDPAGLPEPGGPAQTGELHRRLLADFLFAIFRHRLDARLQISWSAAEGITAQEWTLVFQRGRLTGWSAHQDMNLADYLTGQEILSYAGMKAAFDGAARARCDLAAALLAPEFHASAVSAPGGPDAARLRGALLQFALLTLTQPAVAQAGHFSFSVPVADGPDGAAAPELLPLPALAAGVARAMDPSKLTVLLGGIAWIPQAYPLPLLPLERLPLNQAEGYFLSQVDGRKSLEEIAASGVLNKTDSYRAFYSLLQLRLIAGMAQGREMVYAGFAEFLREKTDHIQGLRLAAERIDAFSARLESGSPYTVLGVSPQSTPAEIRAHYEALRHDFHPSRFPSEVQHRMKNRLTLVNAKISDAYLALQPADAAAAKAPLSNDSPEFRQAESLRLKMRGVRSLKQGEREEAISLFRLCIQYDPQPAEFHYLLGTALRGHRLPARQLEAEDAFSRAIELEPTNGDYSLELANCYVDKMPGKARRVVQLALARTPKHAGLLALNEQLKKFTTE